MYSCGTYKLYRAFIVNLKVVVVTGFETKEHIRPPQHPSQLCYFAKERFKMILEFFYVPFRNVRVTSVLKVSSNGTSGLVALCDKQLPWVTNDLSKILCTLIIGGEEV